MSTDTRLFTPGPLNTSAQVRAAMNTDVGSRTPTLSEVTRKIRASLQEIANCSPDYTAVLLQGSGTFALEAMVTSLLTTQEHFVLVVSNGVYGDRIGQICQVHGIKHILLKLETTMPINASLVEEALRQNNKITHIVAVQFETAIGVLNDVNSLLQVAAIHNCEVMIDAMSSFGALPIDYSSPALTAVASSANKCLHSVPGVSFVIVRLEKLLGSANPRTISLDLKAQYQEFEKSGQWRFTPPTHALLAFSAAIDEFINAGGIQARLQHYSALNKQLIDGLGAINIHPAIATEYRAPMITTFIINNEMLSFKFLYNELFKYGLVIYPSSFIQEKSFRVGCIGDINSSDIDELINSIEHICKAVIRSD